MATIRRSRVLRTISLLITICLVSLPAQAQYSSGTGDANDPYQIASADDLMLFGETSGDYDKHFILTADIDLDPNLPGRKVFDRAVIPAFFGELNGNRTDRSLLCDCRRVMPPLGSVHWAETRSTSYEI